jgi:hypothetical protein
MTTRPVTHFVIIIFACCGRALYVGHDCKNKAETCFQFQGSQTLEINKLKKQVPEFGVLGRDSTMVCHRKSSQAPFVRYSKAFLHITFQLFCYKVDVQIKPSFVASQQNLKHLSFVGSEFHCIVTIVGKPQLIVVGLNQFGIEVHGCVNCHNRWPCLVLVLSVWQLHALWDQQQEAKGGTSYLPIQLWRTYQSTWCPSYWPDPLYQ